jgi:SAM-dependent methyltransferase
MHTNSKQLFHSYARDLFQKESLVLEIGPDAFPSSYRRLIENETARWDTLDIFENPQLTYSNSGENQFPIPDGKYDVVLAANVIEHVKRPWQWLKEVGRICKPGGHIVIVTPVSWPYHPAPVDCYRIYPDGMKALLEDSGLNVVKCLFESKELPGYQRYTPGASPECQSRILRGFFRLAGPFGFPVERAYDTIAIAAKP